MIKYKIISSKAPRDVRSETDFEDEIMNHINLGWELAGGIAVVYHEVHSKHFDASGPQFFQAMTKPGKRFNPGPG